MSRSKRSSKKTIGDANSDTLYNAAASAMVRSIDDKWSYYMSPEEYAAYKLSSANEYAGIGVSVKLNDKGKFEIFAVEDGITAATAGQCRTDHSLR